MCNCIEVANNSLAKFNTIISTRTEFVKGQLKQTLVIPTKKLDPKVRGSPKILVCNYCPLCGESKLRTPIKTIRESNEH